MALRAVILVAIASAGCDQATVRALQVREPVDAGAQSPRQARPASGAIVEIEPPQIIVFQSDKDQVEVGDSVTLTWEVTGAPNGIDIVALPGGPLVTGASELAGAVVTMPIMVDTRFTITARGPSVAVSRSVIVNLKVSTLRITKFSIEPNPVPLTGLPVNATICWSVSGAETVTIQDDRGGMIYSGRMTSGRAQFTISRATSELLLTACPRDPSECIRRALTLTIALPPTIEHFSVSPEVISRPSTIVELSWRTNRADQRRLLANGRALANFPGTAQGTWLHPMYGTTNYELQAINAAGSVTATVTVYTDQEREPNDDLATANWAAVDTMSGAIDPSGDRVFFYLDVPILGFVLAELVGSDGDFILHGPGGVLTRGRRIDPTRDAAARSLPAGRYAFELRGPPGSYALRVYAGEPGCGNGVVEPGEQCDDGNLFPGDGCNPACEIE